MAILLVKAISATHPDPAKDARGCYKRGDPVLIVPDGHVWGALEGLPNFWRVNVPGATVEQLAQYAEALTDAAGKVNRRRAWNGDPAKLSGALRNQLNSTGEITVTLAQVQNFLAKKGLI